MATIKGPINVLSGGIASKEFTNKVTSMAEKGETKFTMPFEAKGWESATNAHLVTGIKKMDEKKAEVPHMAAELERELPVKENIAVAEELMTVADLEGIKGISKATAIKLSAKYRTRNALIAAIKANSVPELDRIRLGILRKAMGV
jgi:hypothetical protein